MVPTDSAQTTTKTAAYIKMCTHSLIKRRGGSGEHGYHCPLDRETPWQAFAVLKVARDRQHRFSLPRPLVCLFSLGRLAPPPLSLFLVGPGYLDSKRELRGGVSGLPPSRACRRLRGALILVGPAPVRNESPVRCPGERGGTAAGYYGRRVVRSHCPRLKLPDLALFVCP